MYNQFMTNDQVKEEVLDFLDHYFEEEDFIIDVEISFLDEHEFEEPPEAINYLKLRRFIDTAYHNIKAMDPGISETLVGKMYADINVIIAMYSDFLKRTKVIGVVFVRDFLESVPRYEELEKAKRKHEAIRNQMKNVARSSATQMQNMRDRGESESSDRYKALNRKNVDAMHEEGLAQEKLQEVAVELIKLKEQLEASFNIEFRVVVKELKESLEEVINTKIYYFDHLLWYQASRSAGVRAFFERAKIEGEYSTKTYLNYYLKNIDIQKSNKSDWHLYLTSIVKILE
jgi:hypothetical protein